MKKWVVIGIHTAIFCLSPVLLFADNVADLLVNNSPWRGEWKSNYKSGNYDLTFFMDESVLSARVDNDDDHSHEGANGAVENLQIKENKIRFKGTNGNIFSLKYIEKKNQIKGRITGSHSLQTRLEPSE